MLDALSDALARQIFDALAPDRSHSRADLDRVPPLVAHALRQRLDRDAGSRLDEAAPWLSLTPEAWRDEALAEARFPADAWESAVRETCHGLLKTLVVPSEALPDQLIPDGTATAPEVLDGLKALGVYPYLAEIVRRYVEKKNMETFEHEELGHLLARIDRRVASELDVDGWMALLTPLYEVIGGIPEQEGDVPGLVLAEAFAARGCPGLGTEVVSMTEVSRDTLRAILGRVLAPEPEAPLAEPEPAAPEAAEVFAIADEPTLGPAAEDLPDDADVIEETAPPASEPLAETADEETSEETVAESEPDETSLSESEPLAPEAADEPTDDEQDDAPEPEEEPVSTSDMLAALIDTEDEPDDETSAPTDHDAGDEVPAADTPEAEADAPAPLAPVPAAPFASARPEDVWPGATPEQPASTPDSSEDDDEPLWVRLARLRAASGATPAAETSGTPLWKQFAPTGETPEASKTLLQAMSRPTADASFDDHEAAVLGEATSNRDWYTENLFGGDADAYERVITQLSGSGSWTEATQIIASEIFQRPAVNMYSDPAVSFTNAVESQLRPD